MIENYIYKTIISFISLNASIALFKFNWDKIKSKKKNNIVKKSINRLLPCLIPVFRWIWIIIDILISFALCNDKFVELCNERINKE